MWRQWEFFRDYTTSCANEAQDMEIELIIDYDRYYSDTQFYLAVAGNGGAVLFNSTGYIRAFQWQRDKDYDEKNRPLVMDVCVPRNQDYVFVILDSYGDGFVSGDEGYVEVYREGDLVQRIKSFGSTASVDIAGVPFSGSTPQR
mmetsp:Transcript_20805/g.48309  ORF Transcript_20805/g.48309 Transcript_20805/m.48309 type:complete len:144 (-) Transcript_20805:1287-1718(-)